MTLEEYINASGANATPEEFGPEMMDYINSRRGPVRPSGPNPELMEYINASGANATPEEFGPELMEYINNRPTRPPRPSPVTAFGPGLNNYINARR
jgi:hypothetical protein